MKKVLIGVGAGTLGGVTLVYGAIVFLAWTADKATRNQG